MSFKSTPHRITAQIRDFRPFQGSHLAFIRTVVGEYMFSELLLTADIGACSRGPELPEIMHWPIWFSSISIDLGI